MSRVLERLGGWVESLPPTVRPAAYGAYIIVAMMLMRGAMIIVPLAIVYVLATSHTPLVILGRGAAVVILAMLGGAASGLAYGLIGRHLQRAFPGGRYLTGIVTSLPYMVCLVVVDRLLDQKALWTPLTRTDLGISIGMALFFGPVIGHFWFAPDAPAKARARRGSPDDR